MPPSKTHRRQTLAEDRIPLREKIGFGLGVTAHVGANGLSGQLISTVTFIQTIGFSLLSPFLAQFYDNFRSPWGRRRPLIMASFVPMPLVMALIYFFPQRMGNHGTFLWLLVTLPLFALVSSAYSGPLNALMIEATPDYHERIRMNTFIGFCLAIIGLASQWIFPLVQNSAFSSPIQGLHWVVGGLALLYIFMGFGPIAFCPEKGSAAVVAKARPKIALFQSMRDARNNRPFCIVVLVRFGFWFCYSVVGLMGVYMNTYYIYGGHVKKAAATYAVLGSAYNIAAMVSLCIYPILAQKLGKKRVLQIAVLILMVGCVCKLFVYRADYPWLQLIVLMTNGAACQGLGFMTGTMFGDIIDHDELLYGKRREALYASLQGWFDVTGQALGGLLCGFVLIWIGFHATAGVDTPQSQHTLQLMKFLYFLLPFCGATFALTMISGYELSEDRVYEIKDELARRHAAMEAEAAESAAMTNGLAEDSLEICTD